MNFAILFQNKIKACTRLLPEEVNVDEIDEKNFAWIDMDFTHLEKNQQLLMELGIPTDQVDEMLDSSELFYFRHRQSYLLDQIQVSTLQDDEILVSPFIMLMNNRAIVTIHQSPSVHVENVLETCEESFKTVGKSPGFVYFLFWDVFVDNFMPQVFHIDLKLEEIEEKYVQGTIPKQGLGEILVVKKMVRSLKKSLSPMQHSLRHLVAAKLSLISDESRTYLLGIFDHLDRLAVTTDSLQDRVHATLVGYNSIISQQINNSMKVLAIIATIMMPLSLLAGIYGTNFKYIPELEWEYGYFYFLGLLMFLSVLMLIIFKRKKWM